MKYFLLSIAVALGFSMNAQWTALDAGDPIIGARPFIANVANDVIGFVQFTGDEDGQVTCLVTTGYLCHDAYSSVSCTIAIEDGNKDVIYKRHVVFIVSNSKSNLQAKVSLDGELVNAFKRGTKLYLRHSNDHCGTESAEVSLIGFSAALAQSTVRR